MNTYSLKTWLEVCYCNAQYIDLNLRSFDMISKHSLNYFSKLVSEIMNFIPIQTSSKLGFSTNKCSIWFCMTIKRISSSDSFLYVVNPMIMTLRHPIWTLDICFVTNIHFLLVIQSYVIQQSMQNSRFASLEY